MCLLAAIICNETHTDHHNAQGGSGPLTWSGDQNWDLGTEHVDL